MNDWIFQKIAFSNQPPYRIKFLMDFNRIRCTSVARRRPHFNGEWCFCKNNRSFLYTNLCHSLLIFAEKSWKKERIRTPLDASCIKGRKSRKRHSHKLRPTHATTTATTILVTNRQEWLKLKTFKL